MPHGRHLSCSKEYTLQVADASYSQDVYNSFIADTYAQVFPMIWSESWLVKIQLKEGTEIREQTVWSHRIPKIRIENFHLSIWMI